MQTIYLDRLLSAAPGFPDAVRTAAPEFGAGEFYGYVQGYAPETDLLLVRLELPDDAPAVRDAVADGFSPEEAEFIAYVPRAGAVSAALRRAPDSPVPDPRPALRAAEAARSAAARRARSAEVRGEMASGLRPRPAFPELDSGLRSR